jgi:ubiquinone/menaquinone biosynthesis C-methylase UbiE
MARETDFTHRTYERRASDYDARRLGTDAGRLWHAHDIEVLDELLPRHARIIEIACGTGRLTLPLASTGRTIVGIELAGAMLREALKKAADIASCTWLQANAAKLPFRDDAFDALYAGRFLNLFSASEALPLCAELTRVVRPGGVLVLHISNALYGGGLSFVRRRQGKYSKHLLWPWQLRKLFPDCREERSVGSYLPLETQLLMRVNEARAKRLRRLISDSPLRYATHTRFVRLVKSA